MFHQGDFGDKFYIILKGKVQVLLNNTEYTKSKKSQKKPVAPLSRHKITLAAPTEGAMETNRSKSSLKGGAISAKNSQSRSTQNLHD